ncbi:MAG TPA: hypothetical protein VGT02_00890 [Methylomirabilota bacterium]|jgi:hypothetical protein|nr:hypothetical protein [Methylomirabilota bacterium]
MSALMSIPTARPEGWTRSATSRVTTPVPHATSSTRSPAFGAARATRSGAHRAKEAGTISRW